MAVGCFILAVCFFSAFRAAHASGRLTAPSWEGGSELLGVSAMKLMF